MLLERGLFRQPFRIPIRTNEFENGGYRMIQSLFDIGIRWVVGEV